MSNSLAAMFHVAHVSVFSNVLAVQYLIVWEMNYSRAKSFWAATALFMPKTVQGYLFV